MNDIYRDLQQGFYNAGLEPPRHIEIDGKVHRYAQPDKPKSHSSWYVFFGSPNGVAGVVGDWRTGQSLNVSTWLDNKLTQADIEASKAMMAEARERAKKARKAEQHAAARRAQVIWNNSHPAAPGHPYLTSKCIGPCGLRETAGNLIVPVTDIDGVLWSIQTISSRGEKRFLSGGRIKGCMYWVEGRSKGPIYVAEGLATAASVRAYTGRTTACAFNAGNLPAVTMKIKEKHPNIQLIVVADNDAAGIKAARQASALTGADLWCPPTPGTDFNDWVNARGVSV
ncbi:toprim domain-containing protein [Spongiibacter marinus]|uniref:toprim domain-containing protein n=1 Tax=Spongiibacter marinus TaxID=354246 RepID=UPI000686FD28|nr:toprim domain-containing protein [Spongiibacter marinus]